MPGTRTGGLAASAYGDAMTLVSPGAPASADARRRALDVLLSDALDPIVEMVVLAHGDDTYEARAVDGWVRFRREVDGTGWRYVVEAVEGRDPLGDQATDRFAGLEAERAGLHPSRSENSY